MKTLVKRVYCPYCLKLVPGREEKAANSQRILCSRCGKPIRTWNGIVWTKLKVE